MGKQHEGERAAPVGAAGGKHSCMACKSEPGCGDGSLQHLDTFVRIADQGSISRAARSLGLSVAMASRHLRSLEREFGIELMRRNTRHLTLTESGQEL